MLPDACLTHVSERRPQPISPGVELRSRPLSLALIFEELHPEWISAAALHRDVIRAHTMRNRMVAPKLIIKNRGAWLQPERNFERPKSMLLHRDNVPQIYR